MTNYKIIFFLFLSLFVFSQENNNINREDENIDAYAKTVKYNGNLNELVNKLTINSKTELEKARALFVWITENIAYDYRRFNKRKKMKTFKCKTKEECIEKKIEWENQYINKVLKRKKGICAGYAELYKRMCDIAGISCVVIEGYIKKEPQQIGRMGILDHAWNAIIIDNQYYYLDATWAAGYCTKKESGKLNGFIKYPNEYYWLTPIDKLSRNHYPKDTTLVVNSKFSKKLFKSNPYILEKLLPNIEILKPDDGIIKAKIGDTIKFSFEYFGKINKIQINTNIQKNPKIREANEKGVGFNQNTLNKQKHINFKQSENRYEFKYIVDNKSIRYIEILFDYKLSLKYLVKIEQL